MKIFEYEKEGIVLLQDRIKRIRECSNIGSIEDITMDQPIRCMDKIYGVIDNEDEIDVEDKLEANEWNIVYEMFEIGFLVVNKSSKITLHKTLDILCRFEGMDRKWSVDTKEFVDKIERLDELSAHAIILRGFKWWVEPERKFNIV